MFNFDDNVRATIVLLNRLRKYRKIIIFAIYHSISSYT